MPAADRAERPTLKSLVSRSLHRFTQSVTSRFLPFHKASTDSMSVIIKRSCLVVQLMIKITITSNGCANFCGQPLKHSWACLFRPFTLLPAVSYSFTFVASDVCSQKTVIHGYSLLYVSRSKLRSPTVLAPVDAWSPSQWLRIQRLPTSGCHPYLGAQHPPDVVFIAYRR